MQPVTGSLCLSGAIPDGKSESLIASLASPILRGGKEAERAVAACAGVRTRRAKLRSALLRLAILTVILAGGLAFTSSPSQAQGASEGWCTTVGAGMSACFTSPGAACQAQHQAYAPNVQFYGYTDYGNSWTSKLCQWKTGSGIPNPTLVQFRCANTFSWKRRPPGRCVSIYEDYPANSCNANNGGSGASFPSTPNPVDILTGSKTLRKVDFETADGALRLSRNYASIPFSGVTSGLIDIPKGAANWYFDFEFELQIGDGWNASTKILTVTTPDGQGLTFKRETSGAMVPNITSTYPLPQTDYLLSFVGTWPANLTTIRNASTEWQLSDTKGNVWTLETFADPVSGQYKIARPTGLVRRDGPDLIFAYGSDFELESITDSFGKSITFDWIYYDPSTLGGSGAVRPMAIEQANLPDGYTVKYTYGTIATYTSGIAPPDRLEKVELVDPSSSVIDKTTYVYDDDDFPYAVTGVLDKDDVVRWTIAYDAKGRATLSEGPDGAHSYTLSYSAYGSTFTRTVTNPLGKSAVYNFSTNFPNYRTRLTSVAGQASANCPASTGTFAYGTDNFLSSQTDEEGRVTQYTRNARGLPVTIVEALGTSAERTTSYTWHATLSLPLQIVRPGLTTDFTYDGSGRLTELTLTDTTSHSVPYTTNGQERTWTFSYTAEGLLDVVDGPLAGTGDTIDYDYDSDGYLERVTNEVGHVTEIVSVDFRGQPTEVLNANNVTIMLGYDGLGRLTAVTVNPGASEAETALEYNAVGDVSKVTLPDGSYLDYVYDDARRLVSIANNLGESIVYTRNAMGEATAVDVKSSTSAIVATQSFVYDELGRLLKEIGASSQETVNAYDKVDNLVETTDPRSKVYGYSYDALNRLVTMTDPDLYETETEFNVRDEVISVTDARALETAYVLNGFGDVIRETSPDTGVTDIWYDAAGRAIKRVDARGVETEFTHDDLGRPLTKTYAASASENVTYTYDATAGGNKGVGHLTRIVDPSGDTEFTYNALGQVARERRVLGSVTYDTDYTYDAAGNVLEIVYPSGRIVAYARDSLGRISGIETWENSGATAETVASGVVYRPFGPVSGFLFGNGILLDIAYDQDSRITEIDAAGSGTTVQDLSYAYDDAGNITAITDNHQSGSSQTFGYDDLNRLSSATGAYGALSYTYDGVGNRLTRVSGATTDTYAYPGTSNRLETVTRGVDVRSFTYLASGQVSLDERDTLNSYGFTYNDAGRLAAASLNGSGVATYLHNALEQRVTKVVGSTTTHFVFDAAGHLLMEADATGAVSKEYLWLDDLPVALVDHGGSSPALYFIHTDHLRTPQKMTDGARALVWDAEFQPFGEAHTILGGADMPLRFPGQIYDPETRLHQNWHRDYDPSIGRYIQSDPIGLAGGINVYSYAESNPLSLTDPTGEAIPVAIGLSVWGYRAYQVHRAVRAVTTAAAAGVVASTAADKTKDECGGDDDREKRCDSLYYDVDIPICRGISRARGSSAGQRCYAAAAQRYAACLRGEPLPPLDTWNN